MLQLCLPSTDLPNTRQLLLYSPLVLPSTEQSILDQPCGRQGMHHRGACTTRQAHPTHTPRAQKVHTLDKLGSKTSSARLPCANGGGVS